MKNTWNILTFELYYRFKRPATYLYFGILFFISFLAVTTDVVQLGGGAGRVMLNAPSVIRSMTMIAGLFGMLIVSAIMGVAVLRDYEHFTAPWFFAYPMHKSSYLAGRFFGSFLTVVFVFSGILLGLMVGFEMPWLDQEKLLPFNLQAFLNPFLTISLPNIFILGALFFMGGALSKRMLIVYTQGIAMLVLYLIATQFIAELDDQNLAALMDPFGFNTENVYTRYWTIAEKNNRLLPFSGVILYNRIIWIAFGLCMYMITYFSFSFSLIKRKKKNEKLKPSITDISKNQHAANANIEAITETQPSFKRLWYLSVFYFKWVWKQAAFKGLLICGLGLILVNVNHFANFSGTELYPRTYLVLNLLESFNLFFIILITFYSGELIWKERDLKMDLIYDSTSASNKTLFLPKFIGMALVLASIMPLLMVAGMIIQAFHGYFQFEIGVYLSYLYFDNYLSFLMLTALAFMIHVWVNHKFLGHAVIVAFFILTMVLRNVGLDHPMFHFAGQSLGKYSDMNGYGHLLTPYKWYTFYWLALSAVFLTIAQLFFIRGKETGVKKRLSLMKQRWNKSFTLTFLLLLVAFTGAGAYIYYNTNILNEYANTDDQESIQAEYEKKLKHFEFKNQPKITDVYIELDLFPQERRFTSTGYYKLENQSEEPIKEIHIQHNTENELLLKKIDFTRATTLIDTAKNFDHYIYALENELLPGEKIEMNFEIDFITKGFVASSSNKQVIYNGTFFNNTYFPSIGYWSDLELVDEDTRKEYGLGPKIKRMDRTDSIGIHEHLFGDDAHKINFEIKLSTDSSQIAIAPGYLVNHEIIGDRAHFHYRMDKPMVNFYSIQSAKYEVLKDKWEDVNLEIYYHKGHEYNLDRMVKSMKATLAYMEDHFAPFLYQQLRIMEFPRYATFAQSFANTVPFSEGIGFIQKIGDGPEEIDVVFYVTAHEIAHQWWGHYVTEANVKGGSMITETMAQYSALMVMKQHFPKEMMREFLKRELNKYLVGRANETEYEQPLAKCENHPYIHYRKGSIVMYALQDYLSEDSVNTALRRFTEDWCCKQGVYPSTLDLLPYLYEVAPDSLDYIIEDMVEKITLYENKCTEASYKETSENQVELTLNIDAIKYEVDSIGNEQKIAFSDWIDIGVYGEKKEDGSDNLIYLKKHKITDGQQEIIITLDQKPTKAGIDPLSILIDRNIEDNLKTAQLKEAS